LAFRGEEQDLQEMLGNLLDNACKWAGRRVEVDARCEGPRLIVTIDDDGKGIARERRQEIVLRGARADEQVEGSGLGLAIVDELARLYGGEVRLDDSPLGGNESIIGASGCGCEPEGRDFLMLPKVPEGHSNAASGSASHCQATYSNRRSRGAFNDDDQT
jgi:signal transduction histidine kinase